MEYREHHYQSKNGLQLYYREYGGGDQAVICLPGLTRNSKDFHEIALHLSLGYRVICPDLRGRGQSARDPNWKNYNLAVYVQDIRRLLAEVRAGQVIILGTSLGGLIAMTMAGQTPEHFKAIIMNDLGPEVDPVGYSRIFSSVTVQAVEVNDWQEAADQCREKYGLAFPETLQEFWDNFAHKTFREGVNGRLELDFDPKIADSVLYSAKAAKILMVLKSIRLLRKIRGVPLDPWVSFKGVSMPCLVLRGENSDILSEEIIDRMQEVKPDLFRVTIPGRGHAPLLDEPESLSAIDAFLAEIE
jgi:pimeloyl-ACP methyl ester carboxylesterase